MTDLLRLAVVGVGALGQHHARIYSDLPGARLAGVLDLLPERAVEVAARHGCRALRDLDEVIAEADAVSVAVPTVAHHAVARRLLEAGKHVLVEKPITTTLAEADDIIELATRRGLTLQAGHVERFNPAAEALRGLATPRFVEVHRLAPFTPRSLDIDVVLDLMIHDLDLVLSLEPSEAVQVDAVGVPVLTAKVDIANARLRFASGLIANVTASRVSADKVRKFRVFSPRTYVSADFVTREAQVYRLEVAGGQPAIQGQRLGAAEGEPLRRQAEAFLRAIRSGEPPTVSGADGRRALALALRILDGMALS